MLVGLFTNWTFLKILQLRNEQTSLSSYKLGIAEIMLFSNTIFFWSSFEVKNLNAIIAAFLCSSFIYLLMPKLNPPITEPDIPSFLPGSNVKLYAVIEGKYQNFWNKNWLLENFEPENASFDWNISSF